MSQIYVATIPWSDDPVHLIDGTHRIGGIENDKRHHSGVEAVVRKWDRARISDPEFGHFGSRAGLGKSELTFGCVNAMNFGWCTSIYEKLSEGTVPAANIYPSKTGLGSQSLYSLQAALVETNRWQSRPHKILFR